MKDIPTPETDALGYIPTDLAPAWPLVEHAQSLERRLTMAREALQKIADFNEYLTVDIASHGLKASEPSGHEE